MCVFALIFNEIIIIHWCKLDENIHKEISKRSGNEMAKLNQGIMFDDNEDEVY